MERKKYLVVMAAGSGSRMGAEQPKQFLQLAGKAILRRTIEVFLEVFPDINVVTVLPEEHIAYWKDYCYRTDFICPQVLVKGGITRFHSVRNALKKVPDGALVAIHDGVRPLLTCELVEKMFAMAVDVPALVPVVPCVDTIKAVRKGTDIYGNETFTALPDVKPDRSVLYGAQTPQIFHSELLKSAYSQAYDTAFTDDASVVDKYGISPSYVIGERLNMKITVPEDLVIAEAVLGMRNN